MKKTKTILMIFLVFGFLWVASHDLCYAQKESPTLTLVYSNNINGEIEPCPT